jgi:hypothetical protein
MRNAVILLQLLYQRGFQGKLLRSITIKNEGFFLSLYRIFTIVKFRISDRDEKIFTFFEKCG